VDIIARQTTAHEQDEKDSGPAEGLRIPAAVVRNGGAGCFHDGKRSATAERHFEVPRHEVEMALAADLAPQDEHSYQGD
jgi:hypothetical protein